MSRPLLAYFGHHKCASTYVRQLIHQVCRELKLRGAVVALPQTFNHDLRKFVEENHVEFLTYTLADAQYIGQLDRFKGFHVIRDPRDVCVSAYYSHLYSHPTESWPGLNEHRRELQSLSKEEGLLLEMQQCRKTTLNRMYTWDYSLPNILEVKFEELVQNPYKHFIEISRCLGILDGERFSFTRRIGYMFYQGLRAIEGRSKGRLSIPIAPHRLPVERLLSIVWNNDFEKQAGGRQLGQEDRKSHYRKGVAGDWRNHFNARHIDCFKELYNPVLIKLGYEQDLNWE